MKILIGLFACVVLIVAIAAWQGRDTTVYAPGFTEAKFRSIRVGMPKEEVLRILGSPVSIDPAPGYIIWTYPNNCPGGHPSSPDEPYGARSDMTFHADRDGKIAAVYGDCTPLGSGQHEMIGHSLEEVRRRYGEPGEGLAAPDRDYYWYSKINGIKNQYVRGVTVYGTGFVGSIEAARIGHYIENNGVRPVPANWIEWLEWNL